MSDSKSLGSDKILTFKGLEVGRASHGLGLHQVIIQVSLDGLYRCQDLILSFSGRTNQSQ